MAPFGCEGPDLLYVTAKEIASSDFQLYLNTKNITGKNRMNPDGR